MESPKLLPQHQADLQKSGLSDETIAKLGFYSETDPAEVAKRLRWKYSAKKLGACLGIPFPGSDGYVRYKPDKARADKKNPGKLTKYESPSGGTNRAYIPPETREVLADPFVPLIVTEGEKKAAKANQEGFPCIGLVGVYGFQKKRPKNKAGKSYGPRELISDLAAVEWKGRTVYVIYDSDASTNPKVLLAEYHLAETLRALGANVLIVRLPAGPNGEKFGLDDFLVANPAEALRELLATAKTPTKPEPPAPTKPNDSPDNPHRLAQQYLQKVSPDELLLRNWRDEWHQYDGASYRAIPDGDTRSGLADWIRDEFVRLNLEEVKQWQENGSDGEPPETRRVTGRLVSDVELALRGICLLPATINAPAWIGEPGEPDPNTLLPTQNGLLDLGAATAGKAACLLPATPNFFTQSAVPYKFDTHAPQPTEWLKFLSQLWPNDLESIATLQQWFGYMLTPDTRQQKILFILGPQRSGKGTIARVKRELIGPVNVAGPTLGSLASNFGLQPLLGKSAAIISDAQLSGRADAAIITERLKAISGEDAITVDRKHREPLTVKLPTRFMILANELPRLTDASGALAGRFIVLRLTRSFRGNEDPNLFDRLRGEMPGILLWAIEGWRQLHALGRFTQPKSSESLIRDMEDLSSPIGAFLRDRCIVKDGAVVDTGEMFVAWKQWCDANGREHPGNQQSLGKDLRAAVPTIDTVGRKSGAERWREFTGVRLRTPADTEEDPQTRTDTHRHACLPLHAWGAEEGKEEGKGKEAVEVQHAVDGHACLRVSACPPAPDGFGTCETCGNPAMSMTCRICRACYEVAG